MINRLSHVSFFVLDQDRARDFYVNTLGFEIKIDVPVPGNGNWLTVSPPGQDLEITLIPVMNGMMFKGDTAEKLEQLIKAMAFGYGVFECNDVFATYEELKMKGVEFIKVPVKVGDKPEAMFKDDSGNFFGLCQH